MEHIHPKTVRRRLLLFLYERYFLDPLEMLPPDELFEAQATSRRTVLPNVYYLHDRGYVELLTSYEPPLFAGARITAAGIDLVEDRYQFNLIFPPEPGAVEQEAADVPILMEKLVEEAEFSALDGEQRKCLLRDVQYLRDEVARPAERWRREVVEQVLDWIEGHFRREEESLPSLEEMRAAVARQFVP